MSIAYIDESLLTGIADAIRLKNGSSDTYTPLEMIDAIEDIETGGGGITPTGTINITSNDTYDVTDYASANVNVPIPAEYIIPSGSQTITSNNTYDVSTLAQVIVNVAASGLTYKTGTYSPAANISSGNQQITTISNIGFTPSKFYLYVKNYSDLSGITNALIESIYEKKGSPLYTLKTTVRLNSSGSIVAVGSASDWTTSAAQWLSLVNNTIYFTPNSNFKLIGGVTYEWLAIQ